MRHIDVREYFGITHGLPSTFFMNGELPPPEYKRITVVGTRRPTRYGASCVERIVSGLAGMPISIVSGLALGIDALAHEAAIKSGLHTIAVPGSSIEVGELYPRTNLHLAERIVSSGGALISQWEKQRAAPWTFPTRNRTMAALADIVLVIEATENSGSLITANEARRLGVLVGAIPGCVEDIASCGTNALIKAGALCVTSPEDMVSALRLSYTASKASVSAHPLIAYLVRPMSRDELAEFAGISTSELAAQMTMLEIEGQISVDATGMIRRRI